ncbi:MAG TPA: LysR family transcriptional regulator [Ferrovibrio sp.]|uniref:LysR family transcriptional regulator n=1 Tax=Ferrovibrio sp. TaxID=1917215 RepID=UPI002ED68FCD
MSASSANAMPSWDDIRFFLELGRQASLSAAARRLKVDHSTVARRVAALERRLGLTLFNRLPRGYALTEDGEKLLASAERMEAEMLTLQRQASGGVALQGNVRISAPPLFASHFLAPRMIGFLRANQGIRIELAGDPRLVDLNRREADLVLRMVAPTDHNLVARRLGIVGYGLYGARDYLAQTRPQDRIFIGYDDSMGHIEQQHWLMRQANGRPLAFVSNDMTSLYQAARAGMGVTVLPHYLGASDPLLRRLATKDPSSERELWLAVHPDLRRAPRIRAVIDYLVALIERERRLLQKGGSHRSAAKGGGA